MEVVKTMRELHSALSEPFAPDEVKWRVGNVSKKGDKATLLTYIDARAVMDRLDQVVGPGQWRDSYRAGPDNGLICRLELFLPMPSAGDFGDAHQWVGKEDGAENTQIEAVKGGLSDAFKRSAVKWGIGRYLYQIPSRYYPILDGWAQGDGINVAQKGKGHLGWCRRPQLPNFALPQRKETKQEAKTRRAMHDPEWETGGGHQRFMAQISDLEPCLEYDWVKHYCEANGWPKPSTLPAERRANLVKHLKSGTIAKQIYDVANPSNKTNPPEDEAK